MKYKEERLGDFIDILSGYAFKTKDFVNSGIPIIKIKNICPPYVSLDDVTYVSKELAEKQSKFKLHYDDVLIAMTGSHINQWASVVGRVARVKYTDTTLLNQRVGKISVKSDVEADLNYIYYFLSQDTVKIELASKAGGAANQANISPTHIENLNFPCPDIDTQMKIGSILRNYDNLIENNQKQIKLLEEAAQRLYKEWFVDLRFPGHENVKIVDGVPEGWSIKRLDEIADIKMGQSPKSEFYNNDQQGLPFHQGVSSYGDRFVEDVIYSTSYTRIAEAGSILFSVRAPVGRLNITKNKIVIGRGLAAINHRTNLQSFLFYMLNERFFKEDLLGNGSIFASITKTELFAQTFLCPTEGIVRKFEEYVLKMDDKISILDAQIKQLMEVRDRLLPKLMSGEIEV